MVSAGVVNTVNSRPPENGSLQCHRSQPGKNDSYGTHGIEGTVGEMPMETHFDADEGEDIHNRTGCYFGCSGTVAPGQERGDEDAKKRKDNRQDRHNIGTGV
jgi:hypothetical protein